MNAIHIHKLHIHLMYGLFKVNIISPISSNQCPLHDMNNTTKLNLTHPCYFLVLIICGFWMVLLLVRGSMAAQMKVPAKDDAILTACLGS